VATPTIEARLRRRFIVMSSDRDLVATLREAVPHGWQMEEVVDLDAVGGFQDILLYRFILLDLDEQAAFDPLEAIRRIRTDYLLNVPVLCFGGDAQARDEARLARADRFFEREEVVKMLPAFCERFGWGGA
jgi:CheY-like chemotaxis protein